MKYRIDQNQPQRAELLALYESVGWTAYTDHPETLVAAIAASHTVFCARTVDGKLAGLARTVSDDHTVAYLQDILVDPEHHRDGIGGLLLDAVLNRYRHVRQFVLLTDDETSQRSFYESRNLTEIHDVEPRPLRSFVRL